MSVILMYHSVSREIKDEGLQIRPDTLALQLEWVAEQGYEWGTLQQALTQPWEKIATVTFDDGFADFFDIASLFLSISIPTTLFLCPGLVGGVSSWTTSPFMRSCLLLKREQIIQLSQKGIKIRTHGWSHKPFVQLDVQELKKELGQCNDWFSEYLGFVPDILAYPYGRCDAKRVQVVADFYEYVVAVEPLDAIPTKYAVPRVPGLEYTSKEWFCEQLNHYNLANFFPSPLSQVGNVK